MSWRPEGWRRYALKFSQDFEGGADAMLEALRKSGHHVDGDASFSSVGEHTTLSNKKNTGNYLFIPDDEAKGK